MSHKFIFPPAPIPSAPIVGRTEFFPIRRIFCVGRNYGGHVREMGGDPQKDPPIFFTKPADAFCPNGSTIAYPLATHDLHHEVELVVALDKPLCQANLQQAKNAIFGLAVGADLTRRDIQAKAKKKGQPWDCGKAFDQSAPMGAIQPIDEYPDHLNGSISLYVDDQRRQHGDVSQMIWDVPQIIMHLSNLFQLQAGDLIFTGTPDGVGPLYPGDRVRACIAGLEPLEFQISK